MHEFAEDAPADKGLPANSLRHNYLEISRSKDTPTLHAIRARDRVGVCGTYVQDRHELEGHRHGPQLPLSHPCRTPTLSVTAEGCKSESDSHMGAIRATPLWDRGYQAPGEGSTKLAPSNSWTRTSSIDVCRPWPQKTARPT